jgi:hypothetical protein
MTTDNKPKKHMGFACWSKEDLRAAAIRGGQAAHARGTAHKWTVEEAREAGRKGAAVSHAANRARRKASASKAQDTK